MLKNLEVKRFLSRLMGGRYVYEVSNIPPYPTIDPTEAETETKTSNYTITVEDVKKPTIFDNSGTSSVIELTLPNAKDVMGGVVRAYALHGTHEIKLKPASGEKVNYNGDAVEDKYAELASVIGNYIEVVSDGEEWVVTEANGVVTKQA